MSASDSSSNLSEIYENIWKNYKLLEETEDNISSPKIQNIVKNSNELCINAIEKINQLNLYSENEDIEEIPTNELKFLLVPAFLGYFYNKDTSENRGQIVKKCKDLYTNFLVLCYQYGLTTYKCKNDEELNDKKFSNPLDQLKSDAISRQQKIDHYKAKVQLEKELKSLYIDVNKSHVDEDIKREYFLKLLDKWISDSIENIESFKNEEAILNYMKKLKNTNNDSKSSESNQKPKKSSFQPFIITKDKIQKEVFGYGYPGVPTLSVDEFYDQRVREGIFPSGANIKKVESGADDEAKKELEASKKDEKEEKDDEEAIMEARRFDEYKDTHRRGWGNRHNRS